CRFTMGGLSDVARVTDGYEELRVRRRELCSVMQRKDSMDRALALVPVLRRARGASSGVHSEERFQRLRRRGPLDKDWRSFRAWARAASARGVVWGLARTAS